MLVMSNPKDNSDLFFRMINSLDRIEHCTFERVDKSWYELIRGRIKELHASAKFPGIEGEIYSTRNYIILEKTCPRDIRGMWIRCIGEPSDPTPFVLARHFEELSKWNPDHPGKRNCDTYRAIFRFREVKRIFGKEERAALDESKKLTIESVAANEKSKDTVLTIPMSLANVITVFNHPIPKKDLALFAHVRSEVYEQCTNCPETSSVVFVACEAPVQSLGLTSDEQKKRRPGIQIAGLSELTHARGFDYLEDTLCPHTEPHDVDPSKTPPTLVRTLDTIKLKGKDFPLTLSGYAPSCPLNIIRAEFTDTNKGAVPMIA